jgi:hypothetical protein
MALILGGICVSVLCLSTVIWIKRTTGRREMEPHSITAAGLHTLLAANHEVLLFDVRQPLDLLANAEMIPGAKRIPQKKCLRTRRSSRKNETRSFTVPAPVIKPVELFCGGLLRCICYGSNFSKAGWQPGKRKAIRLSHIRSPSASDTTN